MQRRLTFAQLLGSKVLGRYRLQASDLDKKVLLRIERDFSTRAQGAREDQDPEAAFRLYTEVQEMPSTTTVALLRVDGFRQIGALYGTTISSCVDAQGKDKVIKMLSAREADRYVEMSETLKNIDEPHHLVPFELYQRRSGALIAIMPFFPHSAEVVPLDDDVQLVTRMIIDISTALETLHAQQYAHMDVKPSNLFMRDGRFYLGDFGSVTRFNERTPETTLPFIPVDVDINDPVTTQSTDRWQTSAGWKASASHDWWMFAATVADKLFGPRLRGPRAPSCTDLVRLLQRHSAAHPQVKGLCDRLTLLIPQVRQPAVSSSVRLLTPPRALTASVDESPSYRCCQDPHIWYVVVSSSESVSLNFSLRLTPSYPQSWLT